MIKIVFKRLSDITTYRKNKKAKIIILAFYVIYQ